MSISTELTRLQKAKTDIKAAIEAKGVTVPSNDRIDEYSTYISQISSGASLNIAYGDTAPSDTSKLWIKGVEAEEVTITNQQLLSTLSTTLSTKTEAIGVAAVGTKIYLFGGNASSGRLNTIQVFDTTNNTISTLTTTLSEGTMSIGTAGFETKIYLFGGLGNSRLNTIQVFDTTNDTITTSSITLPTGANGIGTAAVGAKIYLFGGTYGFSYLNTINVFLAQIPLIVNNILIIEGQQENTFNLLSSPTQVEISVKNVYRGDSSNVAQLNNAYLYNGSVWLNVNE